MTRASSPRTEEGWRSDTGRALTAQRPAGVLLPLGTVPVSHADGASASGKLLMLRAGVGRRCRLSRSGGCQGGPPRTKKRALGP
jgi:hypothetical protein